MCADIKIVFWKLEKMLGLVIKNGDVMSMYAIEMWTILNQLKNVQNYLNF